MSLKFIIKNIKQRGVYFVKIIGDSHAFVLGTAIRNREENKNPL